MAKRKSDPTLVGQLDMFGDGTVEPKPLSKATSPIAKTQVDNVQPANDTPLVVIIANDVPTKADEVQVEAPMLKGEVEHEFQACEQKLIVHQAGSSAVWLNDEWWTTAMVCAYLKLGRKAIWERTRHPTIGFPKPTHFGSCRHRWRAGEVKAWADLR